MKKISLSILLISGFALLFFSSINSESHEMELTNTITNSMTDSLYYHEIPAPPSSITAANILARTVDGLGYRFYWATEGLDDKSLDFDPGNGNRSPREMMDHFVILSEMVLNALNQTPNIRPRPAEGGSFEEKRKKTLSNLWKSSQILRNMKDSDLENCKLIFQREESTSELPLWNLINGPLSDAIYHTGQIVSQRRSAGNPIHPGVSVLMGKTKMKN